MRAGWFVMHRCDRRMECDGVLEVMAGTTAYVMANVVLPAVLWYVYQNSVTRSHMQVAMQCNQARGTGEMWED